MSKIDFLRRKTEKAIYDVVKTISDVGEVGADVIKSFFTTSENTHTVLMLGGRRAGKSTVLASILYSLRDSTNGVCSVSDATEYKIDSSRDGSNSREEQTLDDKRREVADLIEGKNDLDEKFLVDVAPSQTNSEYTLSVSADQGLNAKLRFVDVPGEWMRKKSENYSALCEIVRETDCMVVVVDTPYMMEASKSANEVYNRITEITDILSDNVRFETNEERMIILCPVKCERWTQSGQVDAVVEKLCKVYKNLLVRWASRRNMHVWVMPIETVGGLQSVGLHDAKRYFVSGNESMGQSCFLRDDGKANLGNGEVVSIVGNARVENDPFYKIDHTLLPSSWYSMNGRGFSPKYSEQVGLHLLRFLVRAEDRERVKRAQNEKNRLEKRGEVGKTLTAWMLPTFGTYLDGWKKVIKQLEDGGLIKEDGDGFLRVIM